MASAQDQIGLIMQLRRRGIRDNKVLRAIERVPRELFVDEAFADHAYQDIALPIECGQTISQPFVVAFMTEQLELDERHKVLEIGTGSGYQAAVLSHLCRRVYTSSAGANYRRRPRSASPNSASPMSPPSSATAGSAGRRRRRSTASSSPRRRPRRRPR